MSVLGGEGEQQRFSRCSAAACMQVNASAPSSQLAQAAAAAAFRNVLKGLQNRRLEWRFA